MDIKQLLCVLFICFLGLADADYFTCTTIPNSIIGTFSEYIYCTASNTPTATTTVTIKDTTGNLQLSTPTLTFDSTTLTAAYRYKCNKNDSYLVTYDVSGSQFTPPSPVGFNVVLRTISVTDFTVSTYRSYPSEALKLTIVTPSSADLVFVPTSSDSSITFNPNSITISAGSLSAAFTYTGTQELSSAIKVDWTISGTEANWYANSISTYWSFIVTNRTVTTPKFSGRVQIGAGSTDLWLYTPQLPNGTLTITPQAASTTFNPSSVSLSPTSQTARFTFVTNSPYASAAGIPSVSFTLGGDQKDLYNTPSSVQLVVPKRTITVRFPSVIVLTNATTFSISIPTPAVADVTVSFFSSRFTFNVSSVSFSGNTTTGVVQATPVGQGQAHISFLVGGGNADYYYAIPDVVTQVGRGSFFGPADWYFPTLWVGVESDKIPIRASFTPKSDIIITPSAPDVKFNPPTLTFKAGQEQQFFSIIPQYTYSAADFSSITVSFLVSGTDQTYFDPPSPFTVTINRRFIQTRWSAHLENSNQRHLQKEYFVWATANYVSPTDEVTVTPVSPYFKFKPAVLHFNSKTTRIKFSATVIGVVGSTTIDYIIGGRDGGWYTPMTSLSVVTAIRPMTISQAILSPDERMGGQLFLNPTTSELSTNHVYSFVFESPVLPDGGLKITPRSNHVKFKPSSITLKAHDAIADHSLVTTIRDVYFVHPGLIMQANFSVTPLSAGVHEVWVELSGKDAPHYDVPNHFYLSFFTEERSSAMTLLPSLGVLALIVLAYL